MKFNNGHWLMKQGTAAFSPAEVYFTKIEHNKVVLTCPTNFIRSRGDTLGGINLYITITCPAPDVIRVSTEHYRGSLKKAPSFDLEINEDAQVIAEELEDIIRIVNGGLTLEITKKNFRMDYYRDGELILSSEPRDLSYIKTDWQGLPYDDGSDKDTYMRQMLTIGVDEHLYGMGERFSPFVKNGQSVSIWNEDGGTSTEQSYKNIPFYISDKGYGVLVNHPEKVEFEVGSEILTKCGFSVKGERIDYFIFNGPTMKDVLKRYTDISGKPSLPAPWTFGLWLSTSFTTNYDEETVTKFVDGMFERDIPLQVFHFDCFWMKDFAWCDFEWDKRVFPDPVGMIKRLHDKGLKLCCWINSYIGQESALFDEGMEKGYFIKRKNGDVWQWDMWQPGMAIVDFTNPEATKWYQSKLAAILDMGIDCFKTDFGERIPTDCVYYDGSDPEKMHNYYTYLYNKAVFEVIKEKKGEKEAVLFARSATVGNQKFPVHWGGDCWSNYESMEESIRGGLSLCLSGYGFWSHDIGGFENTSTADVYKRWCAFGLLSTHSRLHGSSSYRVPWAYDDEACVVVSKFAKLKGKLMPYLYRNAIETSRTGVPMMRAMVLEFNGDPSVSYLDKQYMLGDSLLVAPVFNDRSEGKYYLPEGKWTYFFNDEVREGGKWYTDKNVPYTEIPLFVRENSIIALGKEEKAVYDYEDNVTLKAYCIADGATASADVYDKEGNLRIHCDITRNGNTYKISVKGSAMGKVLISGTEVAFTGDLETEVEI
ncbi:MAG: alpha-xylosidase [Lachnospiraceae bacterium]|nr:alpha-xylosidase [Lachnospiraceae bacterium]